MINAISLLVLLASPAAYGDTLKMFLDAGERHAIDPTWLSAICFVESTHRPTAFRPFDGGKSSAYGICQLRLPAVRDVLREGASLRKAFDPAWNIDVAARYFRLLLKRFGSYERAVSAYNAGRPTKANAQYVLKVKERRREDNRTRLASYQRNRQGAVYAYVYGSNSERFGAIGGCRNTFKTGIRY